jgi:hypothetical protein
MLAFKEEDPKRQAERLVKEPENLYNTGVTMR